MTEVTVARVRELASQGVKQAKIAEEFGLSQPHVSRIISGKRWK